MDASDDDPIDQLIAELHASGPAPGPGDGRYRASRALAPGTRRCRRQRSAARGRRGTVDSRGRTRSRFAGWARRRRRRRRSGLASAAASRATPVSRDTDCRWILSRRRPRPVSHQPASRTRARRRGRSRATLADPAPRLAEPAPVRRARHASAQGTGPRRRANRIRQDNDARRARRRDQPACAAPHHHHRRSDRVRARPRRERRRAGGNRHRRAGFSDGAPRGAASGAGRDCRGRDARSGDDADCAGGGGDRSPRVIDRSHERCGVDSRAHRGFVSRRSVRTPCARSSRWRSRP